MPPWDVRVEPQGSIAEPEAVNSIGWKDSPDGDEERAQAFAKRAPATWDEQEKLG